MDFEYAGFWKRFAAVVIDVIILLVFTSIISAILISPFSRRTSPNAPTGATLLFYFIFLISSWLYYTLLESSSKQATVGKMTLGIIVTDLYGNRISFGRANGRYWSKILSALILYIGFIMAGFTEKKQALHDIIASCLVVKKGVVVKPKEEVYIKPTPTMPFPSQKVTPTTKPLDKQPRFIQKLQKENRTYEIYKGKDVESAKKFLMIKRVDKKLYYIEVETPEGTWGMDIEGLYLVRLLPWQKNISLAKCDGYVIPMSYSNFGLNMAARGISDNFVVKIKCGKCEHEWLDGVRYKNLTAVRCPNCKTINKVDSRNITVLFTK
jgi:uncharacterized RDD family membrane protein YckC/phage FluMu protein Com